MPSLQVLAFEDSEQKGQHTMNPETLSADPINPGHYKGFAVSPIDPIKAYKLGFCAGNVVKYIARSEHKNGEEDKLKALWYLLSDLGLPNISCERITVEIRQAVKQLQILDSIAGDI